MDRIKLIQKIFKETKFQNYLEIGCRTGTSFLPINAKIKTAVDPVFKIKTKLKLKYLIKNPKNIRNKYFSQKSDDFFSDRVDYLNKIGKLDVVLIDGLHTFKASLNDTMNSLNYLNKNGVIILHDCYPPHELAASPLMGNTTLDDLKKFEGWTGEWNGDVWKTIIYLKKYFVDILEVCVIDIDYGLGIVRFKTNNSHSKFKLDMNHYYNIDKMTYKDLMLNDKELLNLKDTNYIPSLINDIVQKIK